MNYEELTIEAEQKHIEIIELPLKAHSGLILNTTIAVKKDIPETTKFIIAQRVSSIQNANKIIVMEDGKVNGFGNHDELLKCNEIYRSMYESQTKGGGDFDE